MHKINLRHLLNKKFIYILFLRLKNKLNYKLFNFKKTKTLIMFILNNYKNCFVIYFII